MIQTVVPVFYEDFGNYFWQEVYTKIAFRNGFLCGLGLEEVPSIPFVRPPAPLEIEPPPVYEAQRTEDDAMIPSLVVETGRESDPWVFGWKAAGIKPGRTVTVHHNWKSKLIKPDGSEPEAKILEIAVQFFRWLRNHLLESGVVPFAIDDATVRLCVPAFGNSGEILMRIAAAMQQAGWNNPLLLKTPEPKANTIGCCTRGRNIRLCTGQPDWKGMFDENSAFMRFTIPFARFNLTANESATLAVLDIGSFTSDLSLIDWSSGQTEDYLSDGMQISFAHGIVDNLDKVCLPEILRSAGECLDDLDFDDRERIKRNLYSQQTHLHSGIMLGGSHTEELVTQAIDHFCLKLIEMLKESIKEKPIRWFILTGGGSHIPRIDEQLTAYFEGQAGNGVRPRKLNANEANGNRLDTAIGATSLILEARAGRISQQVTGQTRPEPLPPLKNCSCHGGNLGCMRCGGSGIINPMPEPILTPRAPFRVTPPAELAYTVLDETNEADLHLGDSASDFRTIKVGTSVA